MHRQRHIPVKQTPYAGGMPVSLHRDVSLVARIVDEKLENAGPRRLHFHEQRQSFLRLERNDTPGIDDVAVRMTFQSASAEAVVVVFPSSCFA